MPFCNGIKKKNFPLLINKLIVINDVSLKHFGNSNWTHRNPAVFHFLYMS